MTYTEFIRHVHSYTSDYTRSADTKAGFVIAATGVLVGVVAQRTASWQSAPFWAWEWPEVVRAAVLAFFLLTDGLAFGFAIASVCPTTVQSRDSLVAFPNVARFEPKEYLELVKALSPTDMERQITDHCTDLARIALNKYQAVNNSLVVLPMAALSAAIIVLVH